MDTLFKIIFGLSIFIIFWAMIGYPLTILIIDKTLSPNDNKKIFSSKFTVTVMVVAHNEEKVIEEKLHNLTQINYPKDKIKFLVASDNSVDKTNEIVNRFIEDNPDFNLELYKAKKRMGKTNAQNEAQKNIDSEILVMTDANSMLDSESVEELVATFVSEDISYVTGKLEYINENTTNTSDSEATYWNMDLAIRSVESKLKTITAGNGALYAVRNDRYVDFAPIYSHDSAMPIYYGLKQERAIMNPDAIAYEKAGEVIEDEFGRKVRMNRVLLNHILPDLKILNIFKYGWFTFFYLGHRTSRYLLWISHILLFLTSMLLFPINMFFKVTFIIQVIIYGIGLLYHFKPLKNKGLYFIYYYCMTIFAQIVGVYKKITGQAKPFWEKAESTR